MSQSTEVSSMLGGVTVEDTATSSVFSNEVYQEMNVPSERIVIRDASKYIKSIGFIYGSPEIGTNSDVLKENLFNMANEDMIGTELHKEFDGVTYKGVVVAYNSQTKWFKIEYEEDDYENMDREELLQHLARPTITCDKNVPRPVEKKKRYVALKMTASNRIVRNPKPSISKKTSSAKNTAEYVPLAIREKKRDEYYWL